MTSVERTSKPWFGPRKRARSLLNENRETDAVARPAEFLRQLAEALGEGAAQVEHVRFIDFTHKMERFRYTIALCWTQSDPTVRQQLFDRAGEIVRRTGWYPLAQGERLRSVADAKSTPTGADPSALPSLRGRLMSVESAVSPTGGCSIRVRTDDGGSLLLDSGLPGRIKPLASDQVLLLSHGHADHAGGLTSGRLGSIPSVMTAATAQWLRDAQPRAWKRVERQSVLVRHCAVLPLGDLNVQPFLVPHLPGSSGWIVSDETTSVVFTGDICVRTARHDFIPQMEELIDAQRPRRPVLLLDATMAGRSAGASGAAAAGSLLAGFGATDDVALIADTPDSLLYAYLDLFHRVQQSDERHTVNFIASPRLKSMFRRLHQAFITRDAEMLDPFLAAQYGTTMSSWGESTWLFWADTLTSTPPGRRAWFLTADDHVDLPDTTSIATVGRLQGDDQRLDSLPPGRLDIDTSPWTGHSGHESLIEVCRSMDEASVTTILFHNFARRCAAFARENHLSAAPLAGRVVIAETP